MPYIDKNKRIIMDQIVDLMHNLHIQADGDLNYILYKYCLKHIKPSYNNYKNYCGELNECVHEIRRRILSGYEDEKIKINGDVI